MLGDGDPAPDFDLPRPSAEGRDIYRLSAAASEAPVVVAFYPVADTGRAADLLGEIAGIEWSAVVDQVAVFGVGVGDRSDHERLADTVDVPFPLLLDEDGFFADRFGVLDRVDEATLAVRPALFAVDRDCRIRFAWRAGRENEQVPLDDVVSVVASV